MDSHKHRSRKPWNNWNKLNESNNKFNKYKHTHRSLLLLRNKKLKREQLSTNAEQRWNNWLVEIS